MIAALFVEKGGIYYQIRNVDPWPEERDARNYDGTYSIVAHPPCERWGRYARGGPNPRARKFTIGDDNGCFASALKSVREFGGVLEHPEASHAWPANGIRPPKSSDWIKADPYGYTAFVAQGHYGHRAQKKTWLYAVVDNPAKLPLLIPGKCEGKIRLDAGFHSKSHRRDFSGPTIMRMNGREKLATPFPFANLLISIANGVRN